MRWPIDPSTSRDIGPDQIFQHIFRIVTILRLYDYAECIYGRNCLRGNRPHLQEQNRRPRTVPPPTHCRVVRRRDSIVGCCIIFSTDNIKAMLNVLALEICILIFWIGIWEFVTSVVYEAIPTETRRRQFFLFMGVTAFGFMRLLAVVKE